MNWFTEKQILVPFDFSDESVDAVRVALKLAASKEDVHVVHVLPELPAGDPYVVWDENSDESRKKHARESMEKQLSDLDSGNIHLDIGIGNASSVIVAVAKKIAAGLIIIPSHGRTGVTRFLLGSVAERVVRLAPCPVLVLKHPKSDSEKE